MSFALKVKHRFLGSVLYTEECHVLTQKCTDPTVRYVLYNGEIIAVSKDLISPLELTYIENQISVLKHEP